MGRSQSKPNLFHEKINSKFDKTDIDYIDDVLIIKSDIFSSI